MNLNLHNNWLKLAVDGGGIRCQARLIYGRMNPQQYAAVLDFLLSFQAIISLFS